ncbi:hypothetical protein BJ138DRAFT_693616 [Hygrophoropsis aurantiaca]|uniref:Uncharacterized protein n=1 Tax=Hygrophoropsis aurantiaca TaxID=72124 RepID=A0ACB8ASJ3_9AGAM|nr:hypothetical protein BJ138DRAFT_693616 [Hygrophoropsis aurantiaca]
MNNADDWLSVTIKRLTCHREPTSEDALLIQEAIAQQEEEAQSIDQEINVLALQVERLRRQKHQHQKAVRQYKPLITLARRIPPELLAKISEFCASAGWPRAPLVISQVCSAWRKAAEYPRSWSYIYVDCSPGSLERTRFWLVMAHEAPLYITFEISPEGTIRPDVFSLLLEHATQWRSLFIHTDDSSQMNFILSRCTGSFLRLIELTLDVDHEGAAWNTIDFSAFQNAPCLSRLRLTQPNLPTWSLPFDLTDLHLVLSSPLHMPPAMSANDWTQLLKGLSSLKYLTLELAYPSDRQLVADTGHFADLPCLESLSLTVSPEVNGVLLHLRAPVLRRLQLRSSCDPLGYPHIPSGSYLSRFLESSPEVRLLELYDVDIAPIDFLRCLNLLPCMEELRLHESEITDAELAYLFASTGLCPNLARLDLRWCGYMTGRRLVELVRSRLHANQSSGNHVEGNSREMDEVAVINCVHVKEQDVLDLAEMTICRVVLRATEDHCRQRGCCNNERYRQRFRLRHGIGLSPEQQAKSRIIL